MLRFSNKVIEHFQHPQNVGELENPDGVGTTDNPVCGDVTQLYLRIKDGVVEDAKFKSFGCAVTIASASVFTGKIKGAEIHGLLSGNDNDVVKRLVSLIENELGELPTVKLHCPPATVQAFLGALLQYYENQRKPEITRRIKGLLPLLADYYKRGEKSEHASNSQH